jgi:MFS family permease
MANIVSAGGAAIGSPAVRRKTLVAASGAHILHDGYTDLLYVLLPIWQTQFGLGFAEVGLLRALYMGAMACLQIPAGLLAERIGAKSVLIGGTAIAAAGFVVAGAGDSFVALAVGLLLGGVGASVQHPLASGYVARAFEANGSRAALGAYNFSGDLGKMAFPAATAALLALMPWQPVMYVLALAGFVVAAALVPALPSLAPQRPSPAEPTTAAAGDAGAARRGFAILFTIGVIDTATRMGFLTFLPFLLQAKGGGVAHIGLALTLVFAGGAAGKLVCGLLGARLGVLRTVYLTEGVTAAGIVALLPLPLEACLALLPIVGVALNGTSSVLYGTVPELVPAERRERAFAIFYTGVIGAGAVSPILYGLVSDAGGVPLMMGLVAAVVLTTLPLAWRLKAAIERAA